MFAKEKLMSEAVVKVRKILRLTTESNHNYAQEDILPAQSFLSFLQVVYCIRDFLIDGSRILIWDVRLGV